MGSISIPVDRYTDTHAFVHAHLTSNLLDGHRVIDHNRHRTGNGKYDWAHVLYAAVADPAGAVTAHVILYSRRYDGRSSAISIKWLHEDMLTESAGVTQRLLAKLTPTNNDYAQQWRADAQRWHDNRAAARKAVGAIIRLPRTYTYQDDYEVREVYVHSRTRFYRADCTDDGHAIDRSPALRAPAGWEQKGFEVVVAAADLKATRS